MLSLSWPMNNPLFKIEHLGLLIKKYLSIITIGHWAVEVQNYYFSLATIFSLAIVAAQDVFTIWHMLGSVQDSLMLCGQ
jgi:hypothetical protein